MVDDVDTIIRKRRLLALKRRKLELVSINGSVFYKPHQKQDLFHRAGKRKYRMMRAGNRTGKSEAGASEDAGWLQGERPWYKKDDPARTVGIPQGRPIKLLVITTDWDKVDEIFTGQEGEGGKLWRKLPRGSVKKTKRNHSGCIDMVEMENGSICRFDTVQSFIKNPQSQESSDFDAIHIDEPCPEDQWKANSRGLMDRDGKAWFTLTPLSEMWINDMFFPNPLTSRNFIPENDRFAIQATTYDNPYLTRTAIAAYEATLTEAERDARIKGIPLELSGLVYKEFDWERHVLKQVPYGWVDYRTPPKDYTISYAIDTHPDVPTAILFLAVSPHNQIFFYDELFLQKTPDIIAEEVKRRIHGYRVHYRKCEPAAWIRDPITGGCLADEYMKHGLLMDKSSKAKDFGILRVRQHLRLQDKIYVNPELRQFLYEMNRYVYAKDNRPVDKDDHFMENMYRLLINDLYHINPEDSGEPIEDREFVDSLYDNPDYDMFDSDLVPMGSLAPL